ncbi:amidophosphoribosyltransferase [Aquibacillus sp. 3ASR75-11]|uniref:Amidophosphoribosyltransferase n=1 Tax=Terrihalobacillus insolitus TaxID=2950438 RepID=A0A9X3WY22_9BACI|nr:amidophosphoribosyltransferase [Terrihalobacillus insolitus]MDC3414198.1 amidophosphoribosyltransferase [Terrihalobacillus insolitus]MDC3425404.1 amidophosphoribosyltransferase [Terrihalobacillus insolitus]
MLAEIKGLNEECGVFAIWGHEKAAEVTYYGLHALQHRGQEGAGIVTSDKEMLHLHKGNGLINDVFQQNEFSRLKGSAAVGHARYATQGGGGYENVQPLLFRSQKGSMALAHNGNLVNAYALKHQLEAQGSILQTTSDTEVLAHLIKRSGHLEMDEAISQALSMIKGAYAFTILTENQLFVALDPRGLRPLSLGKLGNAYVISSETCAFDITGATYLREIKPGELLIIDDNGLTSRQFASPLKRTLCSMEYVYFSRPDSNLDGVNVHASRKKMGKELFKEAPVEADVVTGVPDSSISAAIGYSEASGIPYELGLIKNRYVGRTFIQPSQELREQGVKMKLSAVRGIVEGKRVVMVDDSIVRGTTSKRIVRLLKEAGAKEVHVRIASPPIENPCYYGIDTSTKGELIASNNTIESIRELIQADSLAYLSADGLEHSIVDQPDTLEHGVCQACFTGNYPTEIYPETLNPANKA